MNTQESKCPCIDCITKSICSSSLNEIDYSVFHLVDKCELVKDYLNFIKTRDYNLLKYRYDTDKYDETKKYLKK